MTGWCAGCGQARRGMEPCPGCGWPYPPEDFYFAGGVNSVGALRGFLYETTRNVGCAASELTDDAAQELLAAPRWTTASLFLDSGAFSEVKFGPRGPEVAHPITHREWGRRLRLAVELAEAWGDRLWVVTPDRVGCQRTTLSRLRRFRRTILAIYSRGARLILPVQRGEWKMVAFWAGSLDAAGLPLAHEWLREGRVVPGIPSKKDATPLRELHRFAQVRAEAAAGWASAARREAPWLYWHLLGRGPRSRGYGARVAAICGAWERSVVSSDSVLLRAVVGRAGAGRPLTRARDEVLVEGELTGQALQQATILRWDDSERQRRFDAARRQGYGAVRQRGLFDG